MPLLLAGPSTSCDGDYPSIADTIQQYVNATTYAVGVPDTSSANTSGIPAAVAAAKSAEKVVLALGTDLLEAHEEMDAHNITLSPAQTELANAVAAAAS